MRDNIIISGSTDRTLKVWNAETGECIHTLYGHTSTVRCMHLHEKRYESCCAGSLSVFYCGTVLAFVVEYISLPKCSSKQNEVKFPFFTKMSAHFPEIRWRFMGLDLISNGYLSFSFSIFNPPKKKKKKKDSLLMSIFSFSYKMHGLSLNVNKCWVFVFNSQQIANEL